MLKSKTYVNNVYKDDKDPDKRIVSHSTYNKNIWLFGIRIYEDTTITDQSYDSANNGNKGIGF